MKNIPVAAALFGILAFTACKKESPKPKVIYNEKNKVEVAPKKVDSAQIEVADLPVVMDGTRYLIHPIGEMRVQEPARSYGSSRTNNVSYAISNYNRYEITGYLDNLKFQHADSTALYTLTDKKIQIQTVTYLNTIADKTKKQVLVYSLVDSDTNQDGKVDSNDIKSFYISGINGRGFKKLSGDVQELLDWNVVELLNRVYFRTLEDINKNGAFDKNDAVRYHYVDLLSEEWNVTDYEPVQ